MFERIRINSINNKIALKEAELRQSLMSEMGNITEGNNYILPEADEADWQLIGSNTEKGLDSEKQELLREQAIKTYFKSAHGRNIIRLFEKYVVGHGFGIEPISPIPAVKEVWNEFWTVNKMALRKKEIVRRTMRDGESFIRYFDDEEVIKVRFMNPAMIINPDDKHSENINDGIETDPDDIETVIVYYYKGKPVSQEYVQHLKIMVDSDVLRGRSYYEPILQFLTMYTKWMNDRMKLNEIRNTVALIKKVKGNPTQAANIKSKYETSRKLNNDGTTLQRAPKNVSVYTTNQNVDYELKSPNLQAADVQKDGRALLLSIAAGAGLPEFMVSSDASNSSYASTMSAEGPAVMEFEDWQDYFEYHFKEMFRRVIEHAIAKNKIPEFEDVTIDGKTERQPTSTECSITFPDLVSRDIEKETRAYVLQSNARWISDVTASSKLDLDYEEEQRLIEQQDDDDGGPDVGKDEEDLEIEKQQKAMEEET